MKIKLVPKHPDLISDEVEDRLICPFCDGITFKWENEKAYGKKGWECFWCNIFYYQEDNVWYFKRIRKKRLCKKTHLMPNYVLR